MNAAQYMALFTNAFGDGPSAFGIEISEDNGEVVGKINSHEVKLLVVKETPICWMVNNVQLIDWDGVLKPKDPKRAENAAALRFQIQ